ncbi:hypothetical protein [Porphyromonas levii]|uniref:hypothetical protein n=1 Tax=Porphyromonas levii TaxID=28114 RepID=UPI001B8BD4FA|nr:hypothetical protein [Porphyromonas levii]MBR8758707.1 hypothetical protein [Porphyromonas levii]
MNTYQDFVNAIFGNGCVDIPSNNKENNITGTFNYPSEFETFKSTLLQRYFRLKELYENTDYFNQLLVKIKEVSSAKNWQGSYAELVAYDILNLKEIIGPIALENSMSATCTYASSFGMSKVDLDGFISNYEMYFDVKILSDAVGELLNNVINKALKKASIQKETCSILPEYDLVKEVSCYSKHFPSLVDELYKVLHNKPNHVQSKIIENLSYRIKWGGGVNSRIGIYDPYRNAEEMNDVLISRYASKFLLHKPFFLVMVNFPWYNQLHNNSFDLNPVFYRSLARRTFMSYRYSKKKMQELKADFSGDQTVYEVSKKLSGIVFVDDLSIKEEAYNCWIYINPNADNKSPRIRSYFGELLRNAKDGIYDDFEYDNY